MPPKDRHVTLPEGELPPNPAVAKALVDAIRGPGITTQPAPLFHCRMFLDEMKKNGCIRHYRMTQDRNFLRVYIGYPWWFMVVGPAQCKRALDTVRESINEYKGDMYIHVQVHGSFLPLWMRVTP